MLIDAHQHFWNLAYRTGHWPPAALAAIYREFGPRAADAPAQIAALTRHPKLKGLRPPCCRAQTQRWWNLFGPCQCPLQTRSPGEHWAAMESVFHID